MYVLPHDHGYFAHLDGAERSALIWTLEAARALVLGDRAGVDTLLKEESVSPALLDDLCDELFLAGCRPAVVA